MYFSALHLYYNECLINGKHVSKHLVCDLLYIVVVKGHSRKLSTLRYVPLRYTIIKHQHGHMKNAEAVEAEY